MKRCPGLGPAELGCESPWAARRAAIPLTRKLNGAGNLRIRTLRIIRITASFIVTTMLLAPRVAHAEDPPNVRVALIAAEASAQVYFAEEMGFFQRAGLNIELQILTNTNAIAEAVASNNADIGFSAVLSIASAYKKGIPFTIVAAGNEYDSSRPNAAIMVSQNSPIQIAKDLNGKTLGVQAIKSIAEYGPRLWIDKNGGDSSTVKFLDLPFAAMPDALAAGRIDAEWLAEPYIAIGKKNARVIAYPFDAIGKRFLAGAWFASTPWAKGHSDIVSRFAAAMSEASRWANANPAKSSAILLNVTKMNPDLYAKVVHAHYADHLSAVEVQPQIDLAARYGLFLQTFPAAELIYNPAH